MGLAAARTAALAGSVLTIPDLAMDTACCSMASRRALCCVVILSNSSMQQTPYDRTHFPVAFFEKSWKLLH